MLGYAEGLGLVAATLGVWADPAALVRWSVVGTAGGAVPWDPNEQPFAAHLQREALAWVVAQVDLRAAAAARIGGAPDGARLSTVQLGSLPGVLAAARRAAAQLAADRRSDPAVLELAALLLGELRAALAVLAAGCVTDETPGGAPLAVELEETAPMPDAEGWN
ncbi:MAG: hypothetical protein R3B06_07970 [Kofleriaceae bacterium]